MKVNKTTLLYLFSIIIMLFTRLFFVGWDPPHWMPEAFIVDGGWWMNGARGKILFDDWLSEDHGMAILMTPLYNIMLFLWHRIIGFSFRNAVLFSSLCQIMTITTAILYIRNNWNGRVAAISFFILSFSPYFAHFGRVPEPDTLQTFFALLAVIIWITVNSDKRKAILAGFFLVLSFAVKLKAIQTIFLPFLVALLFSEVVFSRIMKVDFKSIIAGVAITFIGVIGLTTVLYLYQGDNFITLLISESGSGSKKIYDYFSLTSKVFVSIEYKDIPTPILWKNLIYSPMILVTGYLGIFINVLVEKENNIYKSKRMFFLLVFLLVSYLAKTSNQITSIILLFFGADFIQYLSQNHDSHYLVENFTNTKRFVASYISILPLIVIIKPFAMRLGMFLTRNISIGSIPGIGMGTIGFFFLVFLTVPLLFLFYLFFYRHIKFNASFKPGMVITSAILLFIGNFATWYGFYSNLGHEMINSNSYMAEMETNYKTIVGYHSATLCYEAGIHTIRRPEPGDAPNTTPLELTIMNEQPDLILAEKVYQWRRSTVEESLLDNNEIEIMKISEIDIGPWKNGVGRFEYGVYENRKRE